MIPPRSTDDRFQGVSSSSTAEHRSGDFGGDRFGNVDARDRLPLLAAELVAHGARSGLTGPLLLLTFHMRTWSAENMCDLFESISRGAPLQLVESMCELARSATQSGETSEDQRVRTVMRALDRSNADSNADDAQASGDGHELARRVLCDVLLRRCAYGVIRDVVLAFLVDAQDEVLDQAVAVVAEHDLEVTV